MNTSIDEIQRQEQINETRKLFIAPSFDPSKYLSHEMNKVIHDPYELEKQLFDLFDSNCNNYTVLSQQIEDEVIELQESASLTESILLEELEEHAEKLSIVGDAVDDVKLNFDKASEGALRIGGRLGISEKEKNLIENGIELLGYITLFEKAGAEYYNSIASMSSEQLRRKLPEGIKDCSWGRISKVLNDLRRVVTEISSTDVDMAAKIIYSVSSVVEFELLSQFDVAINDVMEDQDNPNLLDVARELAGWLHLFNNGDSLQKTYIFTVVKRRIPDDAAFMKRGNRPSVLDRMREVVPGARSDDESSGGADDDDDDSYEEEAKAPVNFSSKQSQEAMLIQSFGTVVRQNHSSYGGNSLALLDHLSGLFTMINNVCQEQFAIIRKIFPPHTVPRVTRQLIQRVFNDPAFGIQARVDAILNPKPPNTPLPLPDYLDALVTVREKLSALYVLLLECASHPLMRGMGSESASLRQAKASSIRLAKISYSDTHKYTEGSKAEYTAQDDVEAEENMRSEAEIREFFDEQIAQVLTNYVTDYFEKEMSNVCGKFTDLLREHIDDANLLTKVGGNSRDRSKLPKIRAEKIRSITQITKTVANKNFINSIFSVTTDAVMRMESICRDDNRLPNKGKDLFLLQFSFLCDSLYTPWLKASISILLKLASGKFHQTLPPEEFLDVLSILAYGVHKVNTHLEEVFMRPLASAPNTVAVCKETRNSSFRLLDALARESLYSWAICIGVFCEKTLLNLQSKYDYSPKFDPIGNFNFGKNSSGNEGTPACSTLCKSVSKLLNAMKVKQSNLVGIDVKNHFWRPLGQLIIGILISHLKKQKISSEGVTVLLKDLEQYSNVRCVKSSCSYDRH